MATRSEQDSGSWRRSGGGGGDDRGSSSNRGGDDRGGGWRGGGGDSRGGGGGWRGGGGSSDRPRLQLKPRGKTDEVDDVTKKVEETNIDGDNDRKRREPKVVNSRAAAFGSAPEGSRRENRPRTERGPPPIKNERFSRMAEEERAMNAPRTDRGPPPIRNERFSRMAEEERAMNPPRERGPPPTTNSRFANAARMAEEEEKDHQERRAERNSFYNRDDDNNGGPGGPGGRFNDDRGGRFNDGPGRRYDGPSSRGPPPTQNSRFANAAAMDSDYLDRDERFRQQEERDRERAEGGGRFDDRRGPGGGGGFRGGGGRGGGGYRRDGGGYGDHPRGPGGFDTSLPRGPAGFDEEPVEVSVPKPKSAARVNDLLKPKGREDAHADSIFKVPPPKKKEEEEKPVVKREEPAPAVVEPEPEVPKLSAEEAQALMDEFASGKLQGDELKAWAEEKKAVLPPLEKLVFHFLVEHEKLNPDPDCAWAEPSKYGAAFLALIDDDIVNQMQVLWGIQFYLDKLGFPKYNDEYVVQTMFRSAYKYDLAADDAFIEWKEDESDDHESGKMKAIIQTVDWFNWLEEEDEEEEEEEYFEEE